MWAQENTRVLQLSAICACHMFACMICILPVKCIVSCVCCGQCMQCSEAHELILLTVVGIGQHKLNILQERHQVQTESLEIQSTKRQEEGKCLQVHMIEEMQW